MNKQLLSLSFSSSNSILLVGAGYMGVEYAKALKKLKKKFVVVGRGEKSAKEFEKQKLILISLHGLVNLWWQFLVVLHSKRQ